MTVIIREVKKEDKEKITKLAKEFVESLDEPFYEPIWLSLLESYFYGLEIKELEYLNLNIYCAEDTDSGELVGMMVVEIEIDRLRRRYGNISLWYTKKSYRGKKIGYKLALKAEEFFRKNKIVYVETNIRDDTPKALAISERFGFKKLYTRLRRYL